ncbi:DUF2207 domain-containing protein [Cellulomonas sp. zg-ZUI188]|uniref:DUF2207 domain-containing protein n=1 Tax=Cellulomonas fengjieae TaxID=2819978 RepID=A0ABS3SG78_9CELL|nr:DUF2207 domain-containing protein [Cellulomonas fengjieae]QVI66919.1 DUF2207 domain-containing protein [Cellulomonas fengjieae]
MGQTPGATREAGQLGGHPSHPREARPVRAVRALLLALGLVVSLTAAAVPDQSGGREITRYDVTAVLAEDGTMRVTLDFDFDFGFEYGHGPYLTLPTRVSYDDELDRAFRYTDISVSSPSGAPADLHTESEDDMLLLRIGDEDIDDVKGVQTYRVEYTADGLLNPANAQHSGDELYWNVIGSGWDIPLGDLSVTVEGPAPVEGVACFAGSYGSDAPCTSSSFDGSTATFTQDLLPFGYQFSTVTGWPAGTFPGVEPILVDKIDPLAPVRPLSALGGVALLVLAGGAALAVVRVRRVGRDRAYLGLTPGLRPAENQPGAASGFRDRREVVSVQFQPPEGVRPGEVGTLVDEKADPVDVTATLVDLAVRGYLRIEEVPRKDPKKKPDDWTLVQVKRGDGDLLPYEQTLMRELFKKKSFEVTLSDLKTTFAASMAKVQDGLYDHVTESGWFRSNPKSVRTAWYVVGTVIAVLGALATVGVFAAGVQVPGLGLVPLAVAIVGVVVIVLGKAAPARTEDGTAVLAQALGFRRYLATAEANQLRFEEGEDIFSRYLPYAIVFGLADRWARVFAELAAQGRTFEQPSWYVGSYLYGANLYWATSFASSMDRFTTIATQSISAPTPGSSGGSGMGGGGFSGGGVGGGGGGGW